MKKPIIWHDAGWILDLSESDGCHWIFTLEWDDGEYHPVDDGMIKGNAETFHIWEEVSEAELDSYV